MFSVIDKGVYTISQTARLLHLNSPSVNSPTVNRWAFGYVRRETFYPPVIRTEAKRQNKQIRTLNFLELVELMHIASLLESGISWPTVREAVRVARKLLANEEHPLATHRWFADARDLYMELGEKHDKPLLVEMAGAAQVVMDQLLRNYLKQIEFDPHTGLARRWHPVGRQIIVVDPKRSFGMPIVATAGVRTDVLVEHFRAGDNPNQIAAWYDVGEPEIEAAVEFEERLRAVAA